MNKTLAALSIVLVAGILFAVPPSAYAHDFACTPGFWKNNSDTSGHSDLDDKLLRAETLAITGYDLGSAADGITIAQAVALQGGPLNAVFRYAGASVYNWYVFGPDEFPTNLFIDAMERYADGNLAGAIERFEKLYEQSTCGIDRWGELI